MGMFEYNSNNFYPNRLFRQKGILTLLEIMD